MDFQFSNIYCLKCMHVDENDEQEKGIATSRTTFFKDLRVIHLKLPCSLSLVFLLVSASRMLCLLVSHFLFPCITWKSHTKIACYFSSLDDKCVLPSFLPKQLCSTSHYLFICFGIEDSRWRRNVGGWRKK